jgi:hypothetical protein
MDSNCSLTAFIADNPVARLEQVEALIKNRVTVKRLHDQMSLSMLPDDVSAALPLYPALKNQGRKVQYFLWSRLQENDTATGEQWMREVGPGAVVIDTGYSGSIPNANRRVDPTASAFLLSSASEYLQLLLSHDHLSIVNNLEYFPS